MKMIRCLICWLTCLVIILFCSTSLAINPDYGLPWTEFIPLELSSGLLRIADYVNMNGGYYNLHLDSKEKGETPLETYNVPNQYLYCIGHRNRIQPDDEMGTAVYGVKYKLEIDGQNANVYVRKSMGTSGITEFYGPWPYKNEIFQKIAYILSKNKGYGSYHGNSGNDTGYTTEQLLIYEYINTFFNGIEDLKSFEESAYGIKDYNWVDPDNSWYSSNSNGWATYADNVNDARLEKENVDKAGSTINVQNALGNYTARYIRTEGDYNLIGPYRIIFSGDIQSINVYNDSTDISGIKFSDGTNEIERNQISSNSDFYIKVPKSIEKVTKVSIKFDDLKKYKATIYLLSGCVVTSDGNNIDHFFDGTETQNLLYGKGEEILEPASLEILSNIEVYGGLRIIKRSSVTGTPISGAIFNITGPSYPDGAWVDMRETTSWSSNELRPGEYTIEEIQAPPGYNLALQTNKVKANVVQAGVGASDNVVTFDNTPYGNLQIQKVDAVTGSSTVPIVQKGVVFKIYYLEGNTKKYIGKNFVTGTSTTTATMDFTEDENQAKEFVTGEDGKTEALINIPIKKYYAKEISLTEELLNYYNVKVDPDQISLQMDDDGQIDEDNIVKIANTQEYISLSGYIWLDKHNPNKEITRNNLYQDYEQRDEHGVPIDRFDVAYNGMKVVLKDGQGNIMGETTSGELGIYPYINGGEYRFTRVPIDKLGGLYVEFTYDGLIYQSVELISQGLTHEQYMNKNNGSKATDEKEREGLDANSKNVVNNGPAGLHRQSVAIQNEQGIRQYTATYDSTNVEDEDLTNNYVTLLGGGTSCNVNASTKETYNIEKHYEEGQTLEIKYVNLGIYEKPQADFSLTQDVESIKVGINGQWHVYNYATKDMSKDSSAWDIGVRFKDEKIGTYTRAIYQSDTKYINEKDKSKELEVYVNYKIALKNESTYIGEVNTIQNYYDKRYDVNAIGSRINEQGDLEKGTGYKDMSYTEGNGIVNEKYKTVTINANRSIVIGARESKEIYIQYKMKKEGIEAALAEENTTGIEIKTEENEKTITVDRNKIDPQHLLYNIAEISSYTVYYNNENSGNIENLKTVAAVDKDSIPGNITPGKVSTYEDDTEAAPPVVLVKATEILGKRTLTGNVFEDLAETNGEGKESNGNGIYEPNKEKTISNVKVTLHEINQEKNGIEDKICNIKQEDNGTYKFEEYIPGEYIITFEWGDNEYRVQNYKGTIYKENRYNSNIGNPYWYKDKIEERNTDAIDDYNKRLEIDDQMARITDRTIYGTIDEAYKGGYTGEIITKMTSTTPKMEFGVEYKTEQTDGQKQNIFEVKNIDFGIIERPAQRLELRKRVSSVRLVLANQQEIVNIKIDEKGNVTGTQNYLTYMKPNGEKEYKGNVRIEMDKELIQGATIQIGYEFIYKNTSELDYMTRRYYLYGTKLTTDKVVTLKPSRIVDYLDKEIIYDKERNNANWEEITIEELKELNPIEEHKKVDYLKEKTILCSSEVGELKPTDTTKIEMNTSKYLGMQGIEVKNEADTVKIEKPTKEEPPTEENEPKLIIEQQIGKVVETFPASSTAESVTIVPSTGENRGYVIPIIVGMTGLIIMGVGIVVIKKKVLKDK